MLQLRLLLVHTLHRHLLGALLLGGLALAAVRRGLLLFGGIVFFKEGLLLDTFGADVLRENREACRNLKKEKNNLKDSYAVEECVDIIDLHLSHMTTFM